MRIFENQITVLLGHNGAGKTTLLNMITGFTSCSEGNVLVGGYDVVTCTKDARESFGYCAQDNILFDDLTVEEHLIFFAVVKGTPYCSVRLEVVTLLHEVGLMPYRSDLAVDLSLGQQRRLCTALAIVSKPRVIILDEPTANMDPDSRREMWELLLKVRRSCTVFLTTQHLDEADVLGDRIAVMSNGRIRCTGSPAFLKQRFGTGYRMRIHKGPKCDVTGIEKLLRKHAPKARLQSDSRNEAVFMLGQIIATKLIITMFKDIEKNSADLGIDCLGMTVTSLEDVLIRVGEEHQVQQQRKSFDAAMDEATIIDAKEPLIALMATTVSTEPSFVSRMWTLLSKKATCIWRQKKQPLFSWLLPPLLLSLLFQLENVALYHTTHVAQHVGDTLSYTFIDVMQATKGFAQLSGDADFYVDYVVPMLDTERFHVVLVAPSQDIGAVLLEAARSDLRHYVFNTHFVLQLIEENRFSLILILWDTGRASKFV
ncbi:phospholipid-transporting ATPase ABCA3-like [Amblyomma americanum]